MNEGVSPPSTARASNLATPIITLLTDFGTQDSYVGAMKGVLASIAPRASVVDLTHGVAPQAITEGAFQLAAAYRFFPPGTVHVAVVDPGVGSRRAIVGVAVDGFHFVAPDNGVLGGVLRGRQPEFAVRIENPAYQLADVSKTFHGRDVLAPVAAHLANGVSLAELGPECAVRTAAPWPAATAAADGWQGTVLFSDHYGNCVTSLPATAAAVASTVVIDGMDALPLRDHYAQVEVGQALALVGSSGYLEIAVRDGNANQQLALAPGATVRLLSE
ncbi:MAG: SAM-dependent chlorinase/fluorinase [Planctomycetota bacterium]